MPDSMDEVQSGEIDELRRENEFLAGRLEGLEALLYLQGRPILPLDQETLQGYLTLEREERRFSTFAITQHPDYVGAWYRYFTLLKKAIENTNEPDESEFAAHHQMAMHLVCVAAGTAKAVLDLGLAGYYAQSITLIRHLFETWLRLIYIQHRPEMAKTWFVGQAGQDPQPPGENKIHSYLMSHTKGQLKKAVQMVVGNLQNFNLMAHPTHLSFQQTIGAREGQFNVGANYDAELCVYVLHEGASALRLILTAMNGFFSQPAEWLKEFQQIESDQCSILSSESVNLEQARKLAAGRQHWIKARRAINQDELEIDIGKS